MAAATLLNGTAFLTGAGSGIGRATALAFARSGIESLALTDRNSAALSAVAAEIKKQYPDIEIETIEIDVANTDAVESSVSQAVKRFGRIDIAVNVAGIGGNGKMTHEIDEENWLKVLDINLNGVWRSQRAELKAMLAQEDLGPRHGRGTIINVSSIMGITSPSANMASTQYTAAKHGVVGLTRADAVGYAQHKIRINAICPGYVRTPLLGNSPQSGKMAGEIAKIPMGRLAESEEIADSITFLASPWSSYITGTTLVADGGYTVN